MTHLRDLYAAIEPYVSGRLGVDEIHSLYWEECGNPNGIPVVFFTADPAAAVRNEPAVFRSGALSSDPVDQRGAGRSTPNGELRNNTTAHLVADLENCASFGGLTHGMFLALVGSMLAVAYAQEFAEACLSLILRGIFFDAGMGNPLAIRGGATVPARGLGDVAWRLPPELREGDPLDGYATLLEHPDHAVRLSLPAVGVYSRRPWRTWFRMRRGSPSQRGAGAYAMARIEVHYFRNNRYEPEDQLLRRVDRICHLPATIVQGRYDLLCPL